MRSSFLFLWRSFAAFCIFDREYVCNRGIRSDSVVVVLVDCQEQLCKVVDESSGRAVVEECFHEL